MTKSLKVLFFGNERIATGIQSEPRVFRSLLESQHQLVGLVIHKKIQTGRSHSIEPIEVLAKEKGVEVFNPDKLMEIKEQIVALQADCGVLIAYGVMVPQEIIDLFPMGILNVHPSLLPRLRGSTPIETALLEGLPETGVSIMSLVAQMDAGPVFMQTSVKIQEDTTKQTLADNLQTVGGQMLLEVMNALPSGGISAEAQDEANATYTSKIKKEDGLLEWSEPADLVLNKIRAYSGWPGTYFVHNGSRYNLLKASKSDTAISSKVGDIVVGKSTLGVQTSRGVLWIESIQPEGKKEMPVQAFLNGYGSRF